MSVAQKMGIALLSACVAVTTALIPASAAEISDGVQADPAVAKLVPESLKQRGVLRVAAMSRYQPFSFVEQGKQVGMIPEMVTAVAHTMGLKVEIAQMDFPAILLGIQSNKYDIGMGEFFVRKDRVEVADFVTEWSNYDAFVVNKGSDYLPQGLQDVCGRKIAILAGSSGVVAMKAGSEQCKQAGKPAPVISVFPQMSDAVLALSSHRAEAVLTGREVGLTMVASGQPFVPSGHVGGGPCATAVARTDDSDAMLKALQAAYLSLMTSGKYQAIHKKWGTDYGMIDNPTIYRRGDALPDYGH